MRNNDVAIKTGKVPCIPSVLRVFHRSVEPGMEGSPTAIVIQFAWESFTASEFEAHGMIMSPSISRSVPKRQAEFFMGRIAAREALRELNLKPVEIASGSNREPVWPKGLVGSITHASGYASASVASAEDYRGIGIDIERVVTRDVGLSIERTVLTPAELDIVAKHSVGLTKEAILTAVFSAKESFFKAAFPTVGYYFGFEAITLTDIDNHELRLSFEVVETLAPELPCGHRLQLSFQFLDPETVFTAFAMLCGRDNQAAIRT